jgi:hypothetical protein
VSLGGNNTWTGVNTFSGQLTAFNDTNDFPSAPTIRTGRGTTQYLTFYGGSSANFIGSVSTSSNPKTALFFDISTDSGVSKLVSYQLIGGTGNQTIHHSGRVNYFTDGTVSAPSLAFGSNTNTGIFKVSTNSLGFVCGGVLAVTIDSSQKVIVGTDPGGSELLRVGGTARFSGKITTVSAVPASFADLAAVRTWLAAQFA